MNRIILFLLFLLCSFQAFALGESYTTLKALDKDGYTHTLRAFTYTNGWGRPEVRLESGTLPRLAPGINPLLGYGRDFDDDGKIDTWFMWNADDGFVRYDIKGQHPFGFDVIEKKLFSRYHTTIGMHLNVLAISVMSYLSIAVSHLYTSQKEFFSEMLDLEEIKFRLDRSQGMGLERLNLKQTSIMRAILTDGYRRSSEKLGHANNRDFYVLIAADVAIWLSGSVVMKWLGKGFSIAGRMFLNTTAGAAIENVIHGILSRAVLSITAKFALMKKGLGTLFSFAQMQIAKSLSNNIFKNTMSKMIRGLITRSAVTRGLGMTIAKKILTKIPHWGFTAASITIGMVGDLRAEEFDQHRPDQLIRDIVASEQVQTQIIQASVDHPTAQTKVKFSVAALLNYKKNIISTFEDADYRDTASLNGTTIENKIALQYIEELGMKSHKPGFALVGYVLVLVERGGQKTPTPVIIPVTASTH